MNTVSKKVLFLGSKEIGYRCLDYLINEIKTYKILGVFINKKRDNGIFSLKDLANKHDIRTFHNIDDLNRFNEVDYLFSVQYHLILKQEHLKIAKFNFNLHMAPLPELRGCNQFSIALRNKMNYFGTTIHLMSEKIDYGDIIAESRFKINSNKIWVEDLIKKTSHKSLLLFKSFICDLNNNNITSISFEKRCKEIESNIYFRTDIVEMKNINISLDSEIGYLIRSVHNKNFEPINIFIGNKKFKLIEQ